MKFTAKQFLEEIMERPLPFNSKTREMFYSRLLDEDIFGASACEISRGLFYCWKWVKHPITREDCWLAELIVLYKNQIYRIFQNGSYKYET